MCYISGEDAHFAVNGHGGFVGVADGVGQWTEFGCDVKKFASSLMHGCFAEVVTLRGASIKTLPSGFSENKVHNRTLVDQPSCSDNDEDFFEPAFRREHLLPDVLPEVVQSSCCCEKQNKECCIRATMHRMNRPKCDKERKLRYECLVCDPASIDVLNRFNCVQQRTNGESDILDCIVGLSPSKVAEKVLRRGYGGTVNIWGASTAIVAGLDPVTGNTLGIANVGDSSIIILR